MKIIKTVQGDQYEQKREFSDTYFEIRSARFSISKLVSENSFMQPLRSLWCVYLFWVSSTWHDTTRCLWPHSSWRFSPLAES